MGPEPTVPCIYGSAQKLVSALLALKATYGRISLRTWLSSWRDLSVPARTRPSAVGNAHRLNSSCEYSLAFWTPASDCALSALQASCRRFAECDEKERRLCIEAQPFFIQLTCLRGRYLSKARACLCAVFVSLFRYARVKFVYTSICCFSYN